MKKLWSTVILLALAAGTCCFCLFYVVYVSDQASAMVYEIQGSVAQKNRQDALKKTKQLDEYWKSQHTMLSIIVHHADIEKIEKSIALIDTALNQHGKKASEFWFESTRTLVAISNLRDLEIPNIANIL